MLDSIFTGMSGLLGYSRGLKTIANNTANMNTPGFKGSTLQFTDLFYSRGNLYGSSVNGQLGFGLNTAGTTLNFKQGELRNTNNALDMAVDGQGLFTFKDAGGKLHYSRAGQFKFDTNGTLINKADSAKVMGLDNGGGVQEISIAGLLTNPPKATNTVKFSGNLSSTATTQTVNGVKVFDLNGGEHALSLQFTNTGTIGIGTWSVNILDGTTTVGTGSIAFSDSKIIPSTARVTFTYAPAGVAAIPVTLDFSTDVTSLSSGNVSNLALASQDGYGGGSMTQTTFDESGTLLLSYSNGQTVKGARLALSYFDTLDAVESVGGNRFDAINAAAWHRGAANQGAFGVVRAGVIEISNVDLSQEFSDLVIMQRGYQSSSQVVSTANEMLQQLFAMKGK